MVSFAVFMYNEEQYIIDTLESIKYQVENYGKEERVRLVLSDDCSKDRTVEFVELWLRENAKLFDEIVRIYGEKNEGTCKKYNDVVSQVREGNYVVIAGDDLFCKDNVFNKIKLLDNKDIVMNPVLIFDESGIIKKKKAYTAVTYQSIVTNKSLRWETKLGSPILNGAIQRRELITPRVTEFCARFKLVDDRPRAFMILQENPNLKVGYDNCPIILSRRHGNSVSNLNSPHRKVHNDDLIRLYDDVLSMEKNPFVKWMCKAQKKRVPLRGRKGLAKMARMLSPYYIALAFRCVIHYGEMERLKKDLLTNYVDSNEQHLHYISEQSRNFMKKHGL